MNHRVATNNERACIVCKKYNPHTNECGLNKIRTFYNQTCDHHRMESIVITTQMEVAIHALLLYNKLIEAEDENLFRQNLKRKCNGLMKETETLLKAIYVELHGNEIPDDFLIKLSHKFEIGIKTVLDKLTDSDFPTTRKE